MSSEWARLFSRYGLPLEVPRRGDSVWAVLRFTLSGPRAVSPQIERMPEGAPVAVQRWVFGVSETGGTGSTGTLRSGSLAHGHTLQLPQTGWLRRVTLSPSVSVTVNERTASLTTGITDQPMVLLRNREPQERFAYDIHAQLRVTDSLWQALTTDQTGEQSQTGRTGEPSRTVRTEDQWHTPRTSVPGALTVWFPQHLVDGEADPATLTGQDPAERPASMQTLLERVPLFAVESVPHADEFLADVLNSFERELADISESSLDELRHFLGEGNLRGNLPLMYGGRHTSPTLFARDGSVIGMLRLRSELSQRTGPDALAGPPTRNTVLESHVMRSVRLAGSATATNAAGVGFGLGLGFSAGPSDPVTGTGQIGFTLSAQAGVQQQITHTLGSGGSAKTSHSLRTGKPLLLVRADAVHHVTLVRPDGPEHGPAAGTRLAGATTYPLILRVPSEATVTGVPTTVRHLPPEVLHLRSLGVLTTPLNVEGTRPLFDDLEAWLEEHGFLPPRQDRSASWLRMPTENALQLARLNNVRKLEQLRSGVGLRAGLDQMVEGGQTVRFEVPAVTGTRRLAFRITAERRYLTEEPHGGVTHVADLTGVQMLNYTGSTVPGDEQVTRVPRAYTGTARASLDNPFDRHGDAGLRGVAPEYTHIRQTSTVTGSSAGSGHEFYAMSPSADGIRVHRIPATYRTWTSYSDGPAMAPGAADGYVTMALPTYRTLDDAATAVLPAPPAPRPLTAADANGPAGALRLPETAWVDRAAGSEPVREAVRQLFADLDRATPTAWDGVETGATRAAGETGEATASVAAGTDEEAGAPTMPGQWPTTAPHWTAAQAADVLRQAGRRAGRETGRLVTGAGILDPHGIVQEAVDAGLSPHHLTGHAHRIFNDSYVVELHGVGSSGAVSGTHVVIEVEGRLTDVRALPRPGVMDYERWIQSVDAAAHTENSARGNTYGLGVEGEYGNPGRSFTPSGRYTLRNTVTDGSTVNDNSGVFRVSSENDVHAHRFAAKATYRVTVRAGRNNAAAAALAGGPRYEGSRIVEVPDGVEFLLSDNDLVNHPEFRLGDVPAPPSPGPSDRPLPSWFVRGGGQIGFGAVTEVRPEGGRSAFEKTVRGLLEQVAPGSTVPGTSGYVPGVLTRINEHATSLGLRTLVNAGPDGHTAFHFVYGSWLGPMLVEVALRARPAQDLASARGRLAVGKPGLDNILGHTSGDGSALPVPGTTRRTHTTSVANALEFSPLVQNDARAVRTTLSAARQTGATETATSTRERRAWQRSMLSVTEADLLYRYEVTVSSRILDEASLPGMAWRLAATAVTLTGLTDWTASAYGRLLGPVQNLTGPLPRPLQRVSGGVDAHVVYRFNGSDTPAVATARARDGQAGQAGEAGQSAQAGQAEDAGQDAQAGRAGQYSRITPAVYTGNPAGPLVTQPGEVAIDMEVPAPLRQRLSGAPWLPDLPVAVYGFDGLSHIDQALRAVDPALGDRPALPVSASVEGMLVRLTGPVTTGRATTLSPAATAPFLGQPGTADVSVQVSLYDPHTLTHSVDTAIDRVEIATDGYSSQTELTTSPLWSSATAARSAAPTASAPRSRCWETAPPPGRPTLPRPRGAKCCASAPRRPVRREARAAIWSKRSPWCGSPDRAASPDG